MNQLKEYRLRLDVNQKMIAEMFDISQQTVSRIESGKREIPTNIQERMVNSTLMQNKPLNENRIPRKLNEINATLLQIDTENDTFEEHEPSHSWEKWFGRTINKLCRDCTKKCKQSSKVKIINCPQFERIDAEKIC